MKPNRGQKNVKPVFKFLALSYPLLKIVSPNYVCTLEELGLAMIHAVKSGYEKNILENRNIAKLGGS
jgi:hypothetical protein